MLFNSIEFLIFLPIVFAGYWTLFPNDVRKQNLFLLICSYVFYGWWNWKFLLLIALCSSVNFGAGLILGNSQNNRTRKLVLTVCCIICFGTLGLFKYYDFFIRSFNGAFTFLGRPLPFLNLILPVGISFYTFHTLSYTIDVYRKKLEPTMDVVSFFLFVSFFPLAMAGPIERASNLLPQIYKRRNFVYYDATDGMRQILWGLFKKMVIADNCASIVNDIFHNYNTASGSTLLMGAILFAFQIYGDFSGYSDIAIGVARLFGFNLMRNFNYPYFSRDIAEFWRRWHISLSTWFRDYLYIPLGGSQKGKLYAIRNTIIIFLVSGFWHGANWTFVVWGGYHALLFMPLLLTNRNRNNLSSIVIDGPVSLFKIIGTFFLVTIGWIFFRADNIHQAVDYLSKIFSHSLLSVPVIVNKKIFLFIIILIIIEWLGRNEQYALAKMPLKYRALRWMVYYCIAALVFFCSGIDAPFIYFQF